MASHTNAETNMEDRTKAALQVIRRISDCPELEGVRVMTIGSMALCHWKAQSVPEFVDISLSVEPLQRAPGIDLKREDLRSEVREALVRRFPREFNDSTYFSCLGIKGTGIQVRFYHKDPVSRRNPSTYVLMLTVLEKLPWVPWYRLTPAAQGRDHKFLPYASRTDLITFCICATADQVVRQQTDSDMTQALIDSRAEQTTELVNCSSGSHRSKPHLSVAQRDVVHYAIDRFSKAAGVGSTWWGKVGIVYNKDDAIVDGAQPENNRDKPLVHIFLFFVLVGFLCGFLAGKAYCHVARH